MRVKVENLGKRFKRNWIFRKLDFVIDHKECVAITGPNGAGKSTLLKIISTFNEASKGKVSHILENEPLHEWEIPQYIGFSAPYLNLIEELTLREHLNFHSKFKIPKINIQEMAKRALLEDSLDKPIENFSSGMKSRFKLSMALFFESELILLDEPTANMDSQGIDWYREEIKSLMGHRNIIIASNSRLEFDFSDRELNISNFK